MAIVKCARCGDTMGTALWTPESNICGWCFDDLRDAAPYRLDVSHKEPVPFLCELCHRIARDVQLRPVVKYQGGGGRAQMLQCEKVEECWARKEQQERGAMCERELENEQEATI